MNNLFLDQFYTNYINNSMLSKFNKYCGYIMLFSSIFLEIILLIFIFLFKIYNFLWYLLALIVYFLIIFPILFYVVIYKTIYKSFKSKKLILNIKKIFNKSCKNALRNHEKEKIILILKECNLYSKDKIIQKIDYYKYISNYQIQKSKALDVFTLIISVLSAFKISQEATLGLILLLICAFINYSAVRSIIRLIRNTNYIEITNGLIFYLNEILIENFL